VSADGRPLHARLPNPHVRRPGHEDPEVLVWLPPSYADEPDRRYPVVLLLHGGGPGARAQWWLDLDLSRMTAPLEAIFVAPDAGPTGWYSNWARPPRGARLDWATFHLETVLDFVDREYRTATGPRSRAVVGISMGGFGALSYAAHRPEMFASATCLSGPPDVSTPLLRAWVWATAVLTGRLGGVGRLATPEGNPADNVTAYRGLRVALFTGSVRRRRRPGLRRGRPGTVRERLETVFADLNEAAVHPQTVRFAHALEAAGVPVELTVTPGSHDPVRWRAELRRELPAVVAYLSAD
jgi:S-formylglutathione hydrolase FrmB